WGARGSARRTESTPPRWCHCTAVSVLAGLRTAGIQHGGFMTARQLPARPSLEQLKRQAKELLQAAQAKDPAALARFRALPAFATITDGNLARSALALHDAQSVIAREHGFDSWNALRERVEELTLDFGAAVTQFIEAATDERAERAERLLALHPDIATANFHTALLLGDASAAERHLAANPA